VLKSNLSRFIPTVMRTLNSFRETAALRAAEARIRRDQANLHGLIENTTDAIWSMDLDFNILVFNSAASLLSLKMTGQPMVEGSCLLDRLGPAMQALWKEAARRIRNRDRFIQEHELEWAGGRAILEIAFHPIATGKTVTGMAMFGKDVTERKRLELAAGEVDEQRRRLVGLYRKMRVPLHGLTRMAGLLAKTPLDEGQSRYVGMMGASVKRLSDLHERAEIREADLQDLLPEGPLRPSAAHVRKDSLRADASGWAGKPYSEGGSGPRGPSADAKEPGRRDRRRTDQGPLRILVVEDNPVNQIVVTGYLEKLGHAADTVANGKEALAAYARKAYDLVLMDLQMPVMDGFAATAGIREMEAETGSRAWIAAMTANITQGTREKCLAVGMDGHMTKPLKLDVLQREVEAAKEGRALRGLEKESEKETGKAG
jgi:PAS domain S-box-containing protein